MKQNRDRNLASHIVRFQHHRVVRLLCLLLCAISLSAQTARWKVTPFAGFETGPSVSATGPDKANVRLTETLTGAQYVVSTSTTAGSCSGTGPVNCDLGSMTNNQLAIVTVVVTPLLGRTITANVTATPSIRDLNNANNNATDTARIRFKPQRSS